MPVYLGLIANFKVRKFKNQTENFPTESVQCVFCTYVDLENDSASKKKKNWIPNQFAFDSPYKLLFVHIS